jgi:hypothetical protein
MKHEKKCGCANGPSPCWHPVDDSEMYCQECELDPDCQKFNAEAEQAKHTRLEFKLPEGF